MSVRQLWRHEVRLVARSRTPFVVLPLLAIVVGYAAASGARSVRQQRSTIDRVQADDRQTYAAIARELNDLADQGNPRPDLQLAGMAWYIFQPAGAAAPAPHIDPRRAEAAGSEWVGARHAVLPTAPLAALAIGEGDLHPYYSRVTIRTRPALVNSDEIENPVNFLSGRFDLAFVLTVCWPLLVLPLVYNLLSDDRESGTLALVASHVVPLRAIVAVRLLVRLGLAVVVTIAASVLTLVVTGAVRGEPAVAGLVVWSAAVVVTGAFWGGVAAMVNTTRWRTAANATAVSAVWLGTAVVVPAVMGEVAAAVAPVPSRVQVINEVRAAGNLAPADLTRLTTAYYEHHPEARASKDSADITAIRGLALQDEVDRRIDPILRAYRHAADRQQRLADRLRFASPPLLIYDSITELAGTTTSRYRSFEAQLDSYHASWRAYFYPLVHARVPLTVAHYDQAPRFTFVAEANGSGTRRAAVLIGAVASIAFVLLAAAFRRVASSAALP